MKRSFLSLVFVLSIAVLPLSACAKKGPFSIDLKPESQPVYNFTKSSQVLACVGRVIAASNVEPSDIFIGNIPDHTTPTIDQGFLTKNAVMMATTAVDRLGTPKIGIIGKGGARRGRHQLQILGSFTELNRAYQSNALSGELVVPGGVELGFGGDRNYFHTALDLALSERNRIVPGTATSISVQVYGEKGNATLTIDEGGEYAGVLSSGYTAQEGIHAAQRLLVETAVAIMVGKYYGIDAEACVGVSEEQGARSDVGDYVQPYDRPIYGGVSDLETEDKKAPPHSRVFINGVEKSGSSVREGDYGFSYDSDAAEKESLKLYQRKRSGSNGLDGLFEDRMEESPKQKKEKFDIFKFF